MSAKSIIVVSPEALRKAGEKFRKQVAEMDQDAIENKLKEVFGNGARIKSTDKPTDRL